MSVSLQRVDRRSESPAPSSEKKADAKRLRMGAAGDAFEHEADRVADGVTNGGRMPEWSFAKTGAQRIQRQPAGDPTSQGGASQGGANQAGSMDQQQAPQQNNYKEAAGKLAEAFLQTDVGKKLKDAATSQPLVKDAEAFVGTLPGKIIAGAAATAAVSTLAATHKALPVQIPEIPLDAVQPGLKVKVTYEGAVDHPTKAMITFSFTPGGGKKKHEPSASERRLAETAPIAASMDEIRAGMHYAPGTAAAKQDEADQKNFTDAMSRRIGALPGTGGVPLLPPAQAGQTGAGGTGWTFSPLANPALDKKLDLQPAASSTTAQPDAGKKKPDEIPVQRKAESSAAVAEDATAVDEVLRSPGSPLDGDTRQFMERRMGFDFSRVRVHADKKAAASATGLSAAAYTSGNHVIFAADRYAPRTSEGRRLLAHELTHVVQQSASNSADAPGRAGMLVGGTPGVVHRKVEIRDLPHGEQSGFARVPELIRRLNAVSTGLTFSLAGKELKCVLKQGGNLSNFDTQMKGFIDQAAVIPMRMTNRHGLLGDREHGYHAQVKGDAVQSGYVDIDDVLGSDDLGMQELLLHILRERTEIPNYARRIGSPSLDQKKPEAWMEFLTAHDKGIESEEQMMRSFFNDPSIQFDPEASVGANDRAFINTRNDHIVARMREGTGGERGVQSIHVEVLTADGKTLTPDQYKALPQPKKSTSATKVQPKAAPGAGVGKPQSGSWLSAPGDALEREADCAADAVMEGKTTARGSGAKPALQRRDAEAVAGGEYVPEATDGGFKQIRQTFGE